ncbi:hypothetical protein TrST_g9878 [Triparma strigata]|uniref:Uncharacterized protein n=1 Tax=Triparma strigata TaxID=1606541 RepID=A0A9W7AHZ4_9STRA|nr:hypothetical protein TrST_g9878 [Triparma strigata]
MFGKKPPIHLLKPFGAPAFIADPSKLYKSPGNNIYTSRGHDCFYLGLARHSSAFQVLNKKTKQIMTSTAVKVDSRWDTVNIQPSTSFRDSEFRDSRKRRHGRKYNH